MYVLGEQPAYAQGWIERLRRLPLDMLEGLAPLGPASALVPGEAARPVAGELYLLTEGQLVGRLNGRSLFTLGAGDLLGLTHAPTPLAMGYEACMPTTLLPYSHSAAMAHLAATGRLESLVEYQQGHSLLLCDAITRLKQPEYRHPNGFKHVPAGEVLIRQGDVADHVFVIIEGQAEVFVDGQKVGEIPKDEIFGAMAVFTQAPRSATVVATAPSTLMVIPKEQFLGLLETQPRIAHGLIESLAKKIEALNRQLTAQGNAGR